MKTISVQETLVRETKIDVEDSVFEDLRSEDNEKRESAQMAVMNQFDLTPKKDRVSELEWAGTYFVSGEDEDDEDMDLFGIS